MAAKPQTIDEYLAPLPAKDRATLQKVRRAMREAAPDATEVISYSMPGIRTSMVLAWFAAFPNHLSFFAWPSTLDKFSEAKKYRGSKSSLHFTPEKPVPLTLVKRIVKAQLAEANKREAAKARKKSAKKPAKKGKTKGATPRRKVKA